VGGERLPYILHFGNVCVLCAVNSEDMVYLRSFLCVANVCNITNNLLGRPPGYVFATWGALFLGIHLYKIQKILHERKHIEFTDEIHDLYVRAFLPYGFTPRSFETIMRNTKAEIETFKAGQDIVKEGNSVQNCFFVVSGTVQVVKNGQVVNRIVSDSEQRDVSVGKAGEWLGEPWDPDYDFLKEHRWGITMRAKEDVQVVRFNLKMLYQTIKEEPTRIVAANKMQIRDLRGKLQHAESLYKGKNMKKRKQIGQLKTQLQMQIQEAYFTMVEIAVRDGELNQEQIERCKIYREKYNIDEETHQMALARAEWYKPF